MKITIILFIYTPLQEQGQSQLTYPRLNTERKHNRRNLRSAPGLQEGKEDSGSPFNYPAVHACAVGKMEDYEAVLAGRHFRDLVAFDCSLAGIGDGQLGEGFVVV